jgi:GT2 family glycosyltransferase
MKHVIIIATAGRKDLVGRTITHLEKQTRLPDEVIVSAPDPGHTEPMVSEKFEIKHLYGARGLTAQRNMALEYALPRSRAVTFFDDDFLPASDYLEKLIAVFDAHSEYAAVMGIAVRDGASGRGYSFDEGLSLLAEVESERVATTRTTVHPVGAYGCNMSIRTSAVGTVRFDERLPLYGWQEDIDFTSQLRQSGIIVSLNTLRGVHLGYKTGRTSGVRLGYSQVVNQIYLVRKGTVPSSFAMNLLWRNLAANLCKSVQPEPWIDRRGRLKGNLLGLAHVLRGKIEPEYILKL